MSENLNAFEPINDVPSLPSLAKGLQDASRKHAEKNSRPDRPSSSHKEEAPVIPIQINGGRSEKRKLTHIVNEMCRSDAGRMILDAAAKAGYSLCFDRSTVEDNTFGYAEPTERYCALNPRNTVAESIVTLAHELRHAHQFQSRLIYDIVPQTYDTKTNIITERAMEADAEAYGCLVAWELKQAENPAPWNEFMKDYPEIVAPFEKVLNEGGTMQEARTAAFLGWYDNDARRDSYDCTHLDELKSMPPQQLKKKLNKASSSEIIAETCKDPNAPSYFTKDPVILESGKYAVVYDDIKKGFERYFAARDKFKGRLPDLSLATVPTQPRPQSKRKVKAVSEKAKNALLQNKQTNAAKIIQNKRKQEKISLKTAQAAVTKKNIGR